MAIMSNVDVNKLIITKLIKPLHNLSFFSHFRRSPQLGVVFHDQPFK
jgi:hypothetical protein